MMTKRLFQAILNRKQHALKFNSERYFLYENNLSSHHFRKLYEYYLHYTFTCCGDGT
jgi:hypothetical protein